MNSRNTRQSFPAVLQLLYLSSLQHLLEDAGYGARWTTSKGHAVRTNSRFYVDDGLLPEETKEELHRMLDIVTRWTYQLRIRIRLGPAKTDYMYTGGLDPSRQGGVHITTVDGERQELPAVSCYTYLGLPLQCNLSLTRLVKDILSIAKQRTWAVVNYAAKHRLQMHTTGLLRRSQTYNALKRLLVFCPLDAKIFAKLCKAQET